MGGSRLVGVFMREVLVDVVEAAVMPVVIGEGVKMIEGLGGDVAEGGCKLELEKVEKLEASGILMTSVNGRQFEPGIEPWGWKMRAGREKQ
jgi:riboflavin biosynthesis pyrimidine reductase